MENNEAVYKNLNYFQYRKICHLAFVFYGCEKNI